MLMLTIQIYLENLMTRTWMRTRAIVHGCLERTPSKHMTATEVVVKLHLLIVKKGVEYVAPADF